jgi:glycosyltransferase involved in cell wall biosynthesis
MIREDRLQFQTSAEAETVLKVLYVQQGSGQFAGIERVIDEVCTELANHFSSEFDIDVVFVAPFPGMDFSNRPYGRIEHHVTNGFGLPLAIRKAARRADYDLIVVPQIEATVISWIACLGLGRRFVLHLHGNIDHEATHLRASILFFVMRFWVASRLAGIFGTSVRQLSHFRDRNPTKAPHYWTPNPVRTFDEAEAPPPSRDAGRGPVFISVGRFAYQKGQDILLNVFARLLATHPTAKLRLIGHGPDAAKVHTQIKTLGLQDSVSVEHFPQSPGIPLSESDVFVSASRWEGWSLAICEALRFGLPVLSTDCDFGPNEILTDVTLGRLVPQGDADKLLEGMIFYCENLDHERQFSDHRKTYIRRFDKENVVRSHADALRQVARSGRRRTAA